MMRSRASRALMNMEKEDYFASLRPTTARYVSIPHDKGRALSILSTSSCAAANAPAESSLRQNSPWLSRYPRMSRNMSA